jgi:hypothetical protein
VSKVMAKLKLGYPLNRTCLFGTIQCLFLFDLSSFMWLVLDRFKIIVLK